MPATAGLNGGKNFYHEPNEHSRKEEEDIARRHGDAEGTEERFIVSYPPWCVMPLTDT